MKTLERDPAWPCLLLENKRLQVQVAPTYGAKIVTLLDRRRQRQWLWRPQSDLNFFTNQPGDPFDQSTLIGLDECIPTVAPCSFGGHQVPDHGEAWSRPWKVLEHSAGDTPRLTTRLELHSWDLVLTRTLSLDEATLRLDYQLHNRQTTACRFLWSLHPLLLQRPGDQIQLLGAESPTELAQIDSVHGIDALANHSTCLWPEPAKGICLDRFDLSQSQPAYIKLFMTRPENGIRMVNAADDSVLSFTFGPADVLSHVGIWINRGGWKGYDHVALEPTNAPTDRLDHTEATPGTLVEPGQTLNWQVSMTVG